MGGTQGEQLGNPRVIEADHGRHGAFSSLARGLHLAAALGKPGVAIYGPTDPASHGPYGGTLQVLRSSTAITSYKRRASDPGSMRAISPAEVIDALEMCHA